MRAGSRGGGVRGPASWVSTPHELPLRLPDDVDLELRLARFEQLISRRPLLLNSVLLRQNPHHVHEWHKRVALHQGRPREVREACPGPAPEGPFPAELGSHPPSPIMSPPGA